VCLEDARIIAKVDHYGKIKVKETLEIELNTYKLNMDDGLNFSES